MSILDIPQFLCAMMTSPDSFEGRSPKRLRLQWVNAFLEPVPLTNYDKGYHTPPPSRPSSDRTEVTPEVLVFHLDITEVLAEDLLAKIFFGGYLNTIDIIQKISCLSKTLQRLAQSTVKLLDLRACTPALMVKDVVNLVARFKNVSELDFSYCLDFDRTYLDQLTPLLPTLKILRIRGALSLDLVSPQGTTSQPSTAVTDLLAQLVELDLSAINRAGSHMEMSHIAAICRACHNLERLDLAWRKSLIDVTALRTMTKLTILDVSLTCLTAESCRELANMTQLQELNLSATDIGHAGIVNLISKNKSSNIQILRLRFVKGLTEDTIYHLVEYAPKLRLLDIQSIQSDGLEDFNATASLRALKMKGVTVII